MKKKFASPASFLAALLCFLLPFATVRCTDNPTPLAHLSGIEFVIGENIVNEKNKENQGDYGPKVKDVMIESNWARLAFLIGLLGLAAAFMKINESTKRKITTSAAILAIFCLAGMWLFTDAWYRSQNMPLVFEYRFGYYLSLVCFTTAVVLNRRRKIENSQKHPVDLPATPVEYL
jgi:hypothetical protein